MRSPRWFTRVSSVRPAADDFRSWPGFRDVADRSPGNSDICSLPLLIKSVSQVSVLIWAAVLRERDWQYLVLKKKYIAHLLLRLNVIGCFQSQGCRFSVKCFFFFAPKVLFSREIKLNRLSEAIDIVKKGVDSLVNTAVGNQFATKYVEKSFFSFHICPLWSLRLHAVTEYPN